MVLSPQVAGLIQVLISGVLVGCIYALLAVGVTLIFGLMKLINFAHGEFLMLGMYAAFWLSVLVGLDPLFSMPLIVVALFVAGLIVYRLIIRRMLGQAMLGQMMATFGLSIFIRGLAHYLWTPQVRVIDKPIVSGSVGILGIHIGLPQVVASLGALALYGLLHLFITKTDTGLALRATAQDAQVAKLMGIDTDWMFALGWGLGLGSLGVGASLLSNYLYVHPTVGFEFALIAFFAVAIGGFGSVRGALVAGIAMGIVEHLAAWFLVPALKWPVVFLMYLVVISLRPTGFFGKF
jgi:branched-chain amino acid transport system permease protein